MIVRAAHNSTVAVRSAPTTWDSGVEVVGVVTKTTTTHERDRDAKFANRRGISYAKFVMNGIEHAHREWTPAFGLTATALFAIY